MRALMYHYVRQYNNRFPNFRYLEFENFKKQLDFFSSTYGFITRKEWDKIVQSGDCEKAKGKIVLTFDDATSCHFDYIFPELEKRGLWGFFYIPSAPYLQKKLLDVHIVHLLCGKFDGRELLASLLSIIEDEMIILSERRRFTSYAYMNQQNYEGVTEFKKTINYFISPQFRRPILDTLLKFYSISITADDFYMKISDLKQIGRSQSILGAHTINHPVMSKLSAREQMNEIRGSFDFLSEISTLDYRTYCHPYGGEHSFNADTMKSLALENVSFSFSVEPRQIKKNDFKENRHRLPRFDCNQFRFGRAR